MAESPYYAIDINGIEVGYPAENGSIYDGVHPPRKAPCPNEFSEEYRPYLQITDNGKNGDGVFLSVDRGDEPGNVCGIWLSDAAVDLVIEALQTVRRFRTVQAANTRNIENEPPVRERQIRCLHCMGEWKIRY